MKAFEDPDEPFGLVWPGKRASIAAADEPARSELVADLSASLAPESTQHLIVGGDNLEVLRHLQKSHRGLVKLIYIDPPYNTGNDFIYPDAISHSAWLSMMYPRLLLAKNLLREDGTIMVSIGDDEAHHLRSILGEIFGERNACGTFVWEKKRKPSFLDATMTSRTEYIYTFAKDRAAMKPLTNGLTEDGKMYPFNNAGNPLGVLRFPARSVRFGLSDRTIEAQPMSEGNIRTTLLDAVRIEAGTNVDAFRLEGEWRYSQRRLDAFVASGETIVIRRLPFRPNYVSSSVRAKKASNLLTIAGTGTPTYEDATEELRRLFGRDVIPYPKPLGLLEFLIASATRDDDLVLDFFAGSGTTGHAVTNVNRRDGGRRRYILVQLEEPTQLEGFPTIFDITLERMRRAAESAHIEEAAVPRGDHGFTAMRLRALRPRA